jgi:small neutral amino acid transporter SnatA (MarC family)
MQLCFESTCAVTIHGKRALYQPPDKPISWTSEHTPLIVCPFFTSAAIAWLAIAIVPITTSIVLEVSMLYTVVVILAAAVLSWTGLYLAGRIRELLEDQGP